MNRRLLSDLLVAGVVAEGRRIQTDGTGVPRRRRGMGVVETNGCSFACSPRGRRIERWHHGGAVLGRDLPGERDPRHRRRGVQQQRYAGDGWHSRESRVERAPIPIRTAWPAVPGCSSAPWAVRRTPVFWLEVVARKRSAGTRAVGARRRCGPPTTRPKPVRDRRQPVGHERAHMIGAIV
jgi:hypothetical protein